MENAMPFLSFICFFFFFKDFLFIWQRETQWEREHKQGEWESEFYLFDNLRERVHWATFCHWYVNYYEDIQGSILGPRDQDSKETYAKKLELYYVPTFYFCDRQDFIIFSDPSFFFFDIKIMYFSLHGNAFFRECLYPF